MILNLLRKSMNHKISSVTNIPTPFRMRNIVSQEGEALMTEAPLPDLLHEPYMAQRRNFSALNLNTIHDYFLTFTGTLCSIKADNKYQHHFLRRLLYRQRQKNTGQMHVLPVQEQHTEDRYPSCLLDIHL